MAAGADRAKADIAVPSKLKTQVRAIVRAPGRTDRRRWQDAGRLDVRAIPAMRAGRKNVFRTRRKQDAVNSVVSLILDLSPSMGGRRIHAACGLAVHLGEALKAAGVPFEIMGFRGGETVYAVKTLAEAWNRAAVENIGKAEYSLGGGTNITSSVVAGALRLRDVANVNRRIMLVLTDGGCGCGPWALRAAVDYAESVGVEVAGLGIGGGSDVRAFKVAQKIDDVRDLGAAGLDILARQLGAAR